MSKRAAKDNEFSKRATILSRALDFINNGEYEDHEDFMVLGTRALRKLLSGKSPYSEEQKAKLRSLAKAMRESLADLMTERGRRAALKRTALIDPGPNSRLRGSELMPGFEEFVEQMRNAPLPTIRPADPTFPALIDLVDAYYSRELVGKLEKIVKRACLLEELEVTQIPNPEVRRYFEEAHRCYLYGFQIACALLCRAIVEGALKETLDPNGVIQDKCARSKKSYFTALIDKAAQRNILKDGRPGYAKTVKRAGDLAIHDLSGFNKGYANDSLGEVVLYTRCVLLDLYGA